MTSMRVGSKPKQGLMNELNQLQVFSADVIAIFYVQLKRRGDWFFVLLSLPSVCLLEKLKEQDMFHPKS